MTRTRTARTLTRVGLGVLILFVALVALGAALGPAPEAESWDWSAAPVTPTEAPETPATPAEPVVGAEAQPAPVAPAPRPAVDVAWDDTYPRIADAGTWSQYDESGVRLYADRLCDLRAEQGSWSQAEAWLGVDDRAAADLGQALLLSGYCDVR